MRSPLETMKDEKKSQSKFKEALNQREKIEDTIKEKNASTRALQAFKKSEDYENMTPFERSLEQNRHQREYLLKEYRPDSAIDENQFEDSPETLTFEQNERRRLEKEARSA